MKPFSFRLTTGLLLVSVLLLVFLSRLHSIRAQFDSQAEPRSVEPPAKGIARDMKYIDQGANDSRLKGYFTPEGVKLEIVAENPVVVNPVGMTFADDGTPYVIEWRPSPGDEGQETPEIFTYKDGTKRTVLTLKKKVKDAVKVLQDTKGKGVYDRATTVLEADLPSGILVHDGWLYLSGCGTVRRYKQKEPGGAYNIKEVIAQGFGGVFHHQVSGLTLGNDGLLYIACGSGDNHVEGSDGSRATVLRSGAVFRCRPDGSRIQTFALGFCNPYRDVAFDTEGNLFHADNDGNGAGKLGACRLLHVAEGADFGWRLRQGVRRIQPDSLRSDISGESPGKMPPLLRTGRGAPSGLFLYNDTRFPEPYRGLLYYPDVVRKLVGAYRVEPRGATFTVTGECAFLKSDDPLFRPCQMVLGPDGAMYVVDWRTDLSGAGRRFGDGVHGRIYRLSWSGTREQPALALGSMDRWAKIVKSSDGELAKALASEDASERSKAQRELIRRGEQNRPALLKLLPNGEEPLTARIAALGALESFWNAEVQKAIQEVLESGEEPLRRLAADVLGRNAAFGDKEAQNRLLTALNDNAPSVRRAVALAMGRIGAPGAADALVNTLAFDDSDDVFLRDGLVRAIESLGKPGITQLLALAESGVRKDTDRVVATFAALRTRAGYEGLPSLLKYPHLTIEQRVKLIRSCGNYLLDPPISLDPIIAYLTGPAAQPAEVKRAGAELLAARGTARSDKAEAWLMALLSEDDSAVRVAGITAAGEICLQRARPLLVKLASDKERSAAEREAARKALQMLDAAGKMNTKK